MHEPLHQWLRVHSRATDACLLYLERVIDELGQQPLLNDFGRSLEKDGLRRPLSVEPYDAARFRDRMVQEERNNVSMRSGDADAERRLYAHRSGMEDQLREERAEPESLDPLLDTLEAAMLLGDPGSGKSECLKGLAVRVAKSISQELETALKLPDEVRLPVFAELPTVARLFGETEAKSQLRAFVRDCLMPLTPSGRPSRKPPPLDDRKRLLAAILKAATTRLDLDMEACADALRRIWRDWSPPTVGLPHPFGALILLDAWDETKERHRTAEFKCALSALCNRPAFRILATSRILGYEAGILDAPPSAGPGTLRRTLVILPFRDKEVTEFIKAFFTQSATADLLIQDIATKPMVMGMIQNPLLATLVCLAFNPSAPEPVALPARRAQVYQAVVDRLLGEAEARRKAGVELKKEVALQIQGILQSLAFHYFPDEVFNEAKVVEFCEKHRPRRGSALAKYLSKSRQTLFDCLLASGLLARHGVDELRFLHLTFQEFFAAGYLARAVEQQGWEGAAVSVRGIAKPVKVSLLIDKKGWHPRWQEVIALTAGQLDDAPVESLLETLMACLDSIHQHRLCLAMRCLVEAREFDRSADGTAARLGQAAWRFFTDAAVVDWSDERLGHYLAVANPPIGFGRFVLSYLAEEVFDDGWLLFKLEFMGAAAATPDILGSLVSILRYGGDTGRMRSTASRVARNFGVAAATPDFLRAITNILSDPGTRDDALTNAAAAVGGIGAGAITELPGLLEALVALFRREDPSDEILRSVVKAIEEIGSVGGTQEFLKAISGLIIDPSLSDRIRIYATEVVGKLGAAAATPEFLKTVAGILRDDGISDEVHSGVLNMLLRMDEAAATPEFMRAMASILHDKDSSEAVLGNVSWFVNGLGVAAGKDEFLTALVAILRDSGASDMMHWTALDVLGYIGPAAAIPEIKALLVKLQHNGDASQDVRESAVATLGLIAPEEATDDLLAALAEILQDEDASDWNRGLAAQAVRGIGSSAVTLPILRALEAVWLNESASFDVRMSAIHAVKGMGIDAATDDVLGGLLNMFNDHSRSLRRLAFQTLAAFGEVAATQEVLEALMALLRDGASDKVIGEAELAIFGMGAAAAKPKFIAELEAILRDRGTSERIRSGAARFVGSIGEPAATLKILRALAAILHDRTATEGLRLCALKALKHIGPAGGTEEYRAALVAIFHDGFASDDMLSITAEAVKKIVVEEGTPDFLDRFDNRFKNVVPLRRLLKSFPMWRWFNSGYGRPLERRSVQELSSFSS